MRKFLLALTLLICCFTSYSQQIAKGLTASNGQFVGFYEYKPTDYNPTATKKYPLIIFLHGIGERGNGTTELHKITWHAIPRIIAAGGTMTYKNPKTGITETFLVLSPQLSYNYGYWDFFYIDEMLKYAKQNLNVDLNRVYLTGLSAGGGGVWRYPNASLTNAQQFAAIAPVCGTCDWNGSTLASTIVAANVGVWAFHATDDYTVSVNCTHGGVDAINSLRPASPAKKTIYHNGGHYIWEIVYSSNELFEWFLGQSRGAVPMPNNVAPVAKAGSDRTVTLPLNTVTLSNEGSYDSDGSITNYRWTQVSGPSTALLGSSGAASTLVSTLVAGSYTFRLTVTDNSGGTASDDVVVIVNPLLGAQPPVANAGKDENIPAGQATVLRGSASTATAGIAKYAWTKIAGPTPHEILSPNASESWIRSMVDGSYTYRLTITDNNGNSAYDDVTINVGTSSTTTTPPPPSNTTAPVANAGKDETIPVGQATVLNGATSAAGAGIKSYSWTKFSGPTAFEMLTPTGSSTWIRNMVAGTYVFRLTIVDNNNVTATDDVVITVGSGGTTITPTPPPPPPSATAPVANAGKDETIPVGQATVLRGASSTASAGIRSFAWSKFSGPAAFEMLSPNASDTWIRNMVAGTYVYRLTLTDNNGVTATDDVVITVGSGTTVITTPPPPSSTPPVANAGKDETIPVGQATVLRGASSTASAGIKSYAWIKFSGPAAYEMLSPNAGETWIRNMVAGTYVYRLTVTDNNGVTSTDDVVINVYANSSTASASRQLAVVSESTAFAATQPMVSFQNPVRNNLDLNWNADYKGNAKIKILDLNGKLIRTMNVKKNQPQYRNSIDVNGLKQGVFVVQIQTEDGKTLTNKFIKK